MVAWQVAAGGVQQRRGGVVGSVGHLLHLRLAPGGFGGGQGENLDDDVCGRRSLLSVYLTISPCCGYCG